MKNVFHTTLSPGENDVYTVPVGKRVTIALVGMNTSAVTFSYLAQVKSGGVYYPLAGTNTTHATNTVQSRFDLETFEFKELSKTESPTIALLKSPEGRSKKK